MSEVTDSTSAAEAEDVDLLGPVDWIVVEFPGSRFDGTIFPILLDLEAQGTIRVLDLVVLKKDEEGRWSRSRSPIWRTVRSAVCGIRSGSWRRS